MRVLMFGWEFPPHISGGLGTACYGLTGGLLSHGIDVLFVVPKLFGDEDKSKFRFLDASEVEMNFKSSFIHQQLEHLKYIQVSSAILPYLSPEEYYHQTTSSQNLSFSNERTSTSNFRFSGAYGKDLMKEVAQYALIAATLAQDHSFDVIHAHDWLTFPAGIIAKQISRKPLIAHIHATEFDRSGENINQAVYDIERKGLHEADSVIAVSNMTRQILIDRYGVPPEKVTVVHNAVIPADEEKKRQKKRSFKIVTFLGRITFQKGPDYFVEAARKVLDKHPDVHFVMAGSGDMMHRMIKRAAQLRMSSHFHFTGFLKGAETDKLYAMSDAYVMPSVSEPFGISPLEAMRSGVPVIISKQSGVSEVLNHAIKVDFWDTDALANDIVALLRYQSLSRTMIRDGSKEMKNIKWENTALKVKNVYKKIIDNSIPKTISPTPSIKLP